MMRKAIRHFMSLTVKMVDESGPCLATSMPKSPSTSAGRIVYRVSAQSMSSTKAMPSRRESMVDVAIQMSRLLPSRVHVAHHAVASDDGASSLTSDDGRHARRAESDAAASWLSTAARHDGAS